MRRSRIVTVALFIMALTLQAKVFIRWPGRTDIDASLARLGGTATYTAPVSINDSDAQLSVFMFNDAQNTTASDIRRVLGISATNKTAQAFTDVYILRKNQSVTRLILIKLPQKAQLLAIVIKQTAEDYKKSRQPPSGNEIDGIPQFPGSTPHFFVANKETSLQLAISKTTATPEAVAGFYGAGLSANGWHPYLAARGRGSIPRLAVYQQANKICFVLASPSATTKDTTVAILHKTLKSAD